MSDTKALSDFFDRLGSDDAFRAKLQSDPVAALASIGIQIPSGLHAGPVALPSKDDVRAKKAEWLAHAEQAPHAMMIFFFLK